MAYAVCCIPVSPLRIDPSHKTEMVTQQLFGELCTIVERTKDHWIKVKCSYDDYEGWCQDGHVTELEKDPYETRSKLLTAEWINNLDYNAGKMVVPMGSSVTGIGTTLWQENRVVYDGKTWDPLMVNKTEETIRQIAFMFLNTSYLWGGKSIYGIDCSGFTQTVYKFLNIFLWRDASQQATQGEEVASLAQARYGDLAFFENEEGKIVHVGILMNNNQIIHASVKVRIDKMDHEGIIKQDTLERTHKLWGIRRYF